MASGRIVRPVLVRLLAVVVSTCVALGIGELGFRIVGAAELGTTSEYSVVYQINSHGLRDGERAYERTPGRRRVVALGDSFTFGSGIPYGARFTDVAEARLGDVEIVNMDVPGYGLDQALLDFVAEGRGYQPDGAVDRSPVVPAELRDLPAATGPSARAAVRAESEGLQAAGAHDGHLRGSR